VKIRGLSKSSQINITLLTKVVIKSTVKNMR
jgi:hypothetical protein